MLLTAEKLQNITGNQHFMVSIHTNTAALAALGAARMANDNLEKTQAGISSGLRINRASDNAAYWSIATTMRSDDKALSAVQDALALGAALVDVTYSGMNAAIEVMDEVKAKLVMAREPGVDRSKVNLEIEQLRQQIYSIIDSSSFAGQNWLHRYTDADDAPQQIVGSFVRDGAGGVSVETLSYDREMWLGTNHLIDEVYHFGVLTNVDFSRVLGTDKEWVFMNGRQHDIHPVMELTDATTDQDIDEMISVVDVMLMQMTDGAAQLGALQTRIALQDNFIADLRQTIERGIGRLLDEDMNEASSRLKAQQAQVQLANQALGIANAQAESVLQLFR